MGIAEQAAKANAAALELMDIANQRAAQKKEDDAPVDATAEERKKAQATLDKMKCRMGLAIEEQPPQSGRKRAVKVVAVVPGGSSDLAGLMRGDEILDFNNQAVTDSKMFAVYQGKAKAGDDIFLSVRRGDVMKKIIVRMGAQGFTLEQIAKLRKIAASGQQTVGVVRINAGSHKGALLESTHLQTALSSATFHARHF